MDGGHQEDQPENNAMVQEDTAKKKKKKKKSGRSGWATFNAKCKEQRKEKRMQKRRDAQLAQIIKKSKSTAPPPHRLRGKVTVSKGRWRQSGVLRIVRTFRHVMTQTDDEENTWVYRNSSRFNNMPEFTLEFGGGLEDGEEEEIEGDPEIAGVNEDEDGDFDPNAGGSIVAVGAF